MYVSIDFKAFRFKGLLELMDKFPPLFSPLNHKLTEEGFSGVGWGEQIYCQVVSHFLESGNVMLLVHTVYFCPVEKGTFSCLPENVLSALLPFRCLKRSLPLDVASLCSAQLYRAALTTHAV